MIVDYRGSQGLFAESNFELNRLPTIALLIVWTLGCDMHVYVPEVTEGFPSSGQAPFFQGMISVKGSYGNGDVNCDVYEYVTSYENDAMFWESIENSAVAEGWAPGKRYGRWCRSYQRSFPGDAKFWSFWEVRISRCARIRRVVVAFVYDSFDPKRAKPGLSGGTKAFAARNVWPRLSCDK